MLLDLPGLGFALGQKKEIMTTELNMPDQLHHLARVLAEAKRAKDKRDRFRMELDTAQKEFEVAVKSVAKALEPLPELTIEVLRELGLDKNVRGRDPLNPRPCDPPHQPPMCGCVATRVGDRCECGETQEYKKNDRWVCVACDTPAYSDPNQDS